MPTVSQLSKHYSSSHSFYRNNPKAVGRGAGFAKKYLRQREGNFLDIGCASGDFLYGIKFASNWKVYGSDVNSQVVKEASARLGIEIRHGEIQTLDFPDNFFDFIHVRDVLEHVTNPMEFLAKCRRLLKSSGTLYLSVPNGDADLGSKVRGFRSSQKPLITEAGHIFFFSADCLRRMFQVAGFRVKSSFSFGFKNGFRSFGLFPRSRNKLANKKLTPADTKTREFFLPRKDLDPPRFKYIVRFLLDELFRLPGIYRHAFDFVFILEPAAVPPEAGS